MYSNLISLRQYVCHLTPLPFNSRPDGFFLNVVRIGTHVELCDCLIINIHPSCYQVFIIIILRQASVLPRENLP